MIFFIILMDGEIHFHDLKYTFNFFFLFTMPFSFNNALTLYFRGILMLHCSPWTLKQRFILKLQQIMIYEEKLFTFTSSRKLCEINFVQTLKTKKRINGLYVIVNDYREILYTKIRDHFFRCKWNLLHSKLIEKIQNDFI